MGLETLAEDDSLSYSGRRFEQTTALPCSVELCLWMPDPTFCQRKITESTTKCQPIHTSKVETTCAEFF